MIELIGALLAIGFFMAAVHRHWYFVHDDAFISLRYARNLVESGALVWNLGERAEGYTNFFHVLGSALLMGAGFSGIVAARVINVLGTIGLFAAAFGLLRLGAPGPRNAIVRAAALISIGATPALPIWMLGGLESVVVAAFLALGTLGVVSLHYHERSSPVRLAAIGTAFALAVLTRLDAAIFIAATALATLFFLPLSLRRRIVVAVVIVGVPAAVSLAHMAWRLSYYGEFMPLTFYAKLGVSHAMRWQRLPESLWRMLPVALIVFAALSAAVAALTTRRLSKLAMLLTIPISVHVAYVLWAGGDHMPGARLLVPVVVPSATLIAVIIAALPARQRAAAASLMAMSVMLAGASVGDLKKDRAAYIGTVVGRYISEAWPTGSLVALNTAGSTPYFAPGLRFIDMLGLNDPVIARRDEIPWRSVSQTMPGHAKGDGRYVLGRRPDFIILGGAQGHPKTAPRFLSDVEIVEMPEFDACYQEHVDRIPFPFWEAETADPWAYPIVFTYYQRICG